MFTQRFLFAIHYNCGWWMAPFCLCLSSYLCLRLLVSLFSLTHACHSLSLCFCLALSFWLSVFLSIKDSEVHARTCHRTLCNCAWRTCSASLKSGRLYGVFMLPRRLWPRGLTSRLAFATEELDNGQLLIHHQYLSSTRKANVFVLEGVSHYVGHGGQVLRLRVFDL